MSGDTTRTVAHAPIGAPVVRMHSGPAEVIDPSPVETKRLLTELLSEVRAIRAIAERNERRAAWSADARIKR